MPDQLPQYISTLDALQLVEDSLAALCAGVEILTGWKTAIYQIGVVESTISMVDPDGKTHTRTYPTPASGGGVDMRLYDSSSDDPAARIIGRKNN